MLNNRSNKLNFNRSVFGHKKNRNLDVLHQSQSTTVGFGLVIDTLDILFLEKYARPLNTVEELLLKGIWQRKTYSEIATENNYSSDYFSNVAAPKLFKQLSELVRYRVNKKNCRSILTSHIIYVAKNISIFQNDEIKRSKHESGSTMLKNDEYSIRLESNLFKSYFLQDAIFLAQIV